MADILALFPWLSAAAHYWWLGLVIGWIFLLCIVSANGNPPANLHLWEDEKHEDNDHQ